MKVLVIGGTGTVGSQVVRELLKRQVDVAVLTRDRTKPMPIGAHAVVGDLLDPSTVRSVFRDMDGVFLINPVSLTESHEGLMAVNGAVLAGVKRLVYSSVHQVDRVARLPHFGSKIGIEAAVRDSRIPFTILRPDSYFQNDYRLKQAILEAGVYSQPLGRVGTARVDVRDLAEAAAIALTERGHDGETYDVVGPEVLTGPSSAEAWSRALGRKVVYVGDDMDAWERQMQAFLPPWMAFDLRQMYEHFQRNGLIPSAEAVPRLTQLLRHPPRRFDDFARETVAAWANPAPG